MKYEDLKFVFKDTHGTAFIGLDTTSSVVLKGGKKNPLQGRVEKRVIGSNVMVAFGEGSVYEGVVKRRMIAEGKDPSTFELKPRKWGIRIDGTPYIEHGDKNYLECIFIKAGEVSYLVDGVETNPADIEGLELKADKEDEEPKEDTTQGGIENKVIIRTYSVDSIDRIRFKGEHS